MSKGKRGATELRACDYCPRKNLKPRGFSSHFRKCKERHEQAVKNSLQSHRDDTPPEMPVDDMGPCMVSNVAEDAMEGIECLHNDNMSSADVQGSDIPAPDAASHEAPRHPRAYIRIEFHPNSGRKPEIIPLTPEDTEHPEEPESSDTSTSSAAPSTSAPSNMPASDSFPSKPKCPWAPFASKEDFEFAEFIVKTLMSRTDVNSLLSYLHHSWSRDGARVSFRTYDDVIKALEQARSYVPDFEFGEVSVKYRGKMYTHQFLFRDPWRWCVSLTKDPVLAKTHIWHSTRKYYCEDGKEDRLIDETNSADTWWDIETELGPGHYVLPLHIWLDKCRVTNKVKMHPMVLRPLWQPCGIRNASGNGGGVLVGYMPLILDPFDPTNETPADEGEFALYKRRVYDAVLERIFRSCLVPNQVGHFMRCSDQQQRTVHPCVVIESMDAEEAAYFCGCRAATADHPCPKCLIYKGDLSSLTTTARARTSEWMKEVVEQALSAPPQERKAILQQHGLHMIKNFLWAFSHSDPYAAYAYDVLHTDDLGKFGYHLWGVLRGHLEDHKLAMQVDFNMSRMPRWPGLIHFGHGDSKRLSEVDFSDGNTFNSMAHSVLPSIVQVMPDNSSLVQCISWYQAYRVMASLCCISTAQMTYLDTTIMKKYQYWCKKVTNDHDKSFDFLKQHFASHVISSIQSKGALENQTTRTGEGFIQEVKQQYKRTNGRDAAKQMTRQDVYAEAVAQIRTAVNEAEAAASAALDDSPANESDTEKSDNADVESGPASLGSSSRRWTHVADVEQLLSGDPLFRNLESRLRDYLGNNYPQFARGLTGNIKIDVHKCLYIQYSSLEDFRSARDILRCSETWQKHDSRHDCVLLEEPEHEPARLQLLMRCKLMMTGETMDIAAVTRFVKSTWTPRTKYRGCRVFKELPSLEFMKPERFVRGAFVCPAFGGPEDTFYLLDSIGGNDMFLRLNRLSVPDLL